MTKYFFDVVSRERNRFHYDYNGRLLDAPEKAFDLAELLAIDLGMEGDGEWTGWTVNVRDAQGRQFYSIAIRCPDLLAA